MSRQFTYDGPHRYGAPMGRPSAPDLAPPIRLFAVRLDSGGYDDGGHYWGLRPLGQRLYCARDPDGDEQFTTARTRAEAAQALGIERADLTKPITGATPMRWAQKTLHLIEAGTLDEGIIRALRTRLRRAYNHPILNRGQQFRYCTTEEADTIVRAVESCWPEVSAEHYRKGKAWLRGLAYTPNGVRRKTDTAQQFTDADLAVLRDCTAFKLVGFDFDTDPRGYVRALLPIYRCIGPAGGFTYRAASWQSGYAQLLIEVHA